MRERLQKAIQVLVGMPLWSSGRAADLQWFQFGQRRSVTDRYCETKEVGEYALHVQCAWRIRREDQVIVGSRDLYDVEDNSRRDKRVAGLFQNGMPQLSVGDVVVGAAGAFTLILNDGYALEVFPDDSLRDEHWRIFKPYSQESHLVFTGKGIED